MASIINGRSEIRKRSTLGLNQENVSAGSDRMSPLDIERRLRRPTLTILGQFRATHLIHNSKAGRIVQAKGLVEHGQSPHNVGIIACRHDGDRLSRSVGRSAAET